MQKDYGGIIWTKHALERMRLRRISQGDAWAAWKKPDASKYSRKNGTFTYWKNYPKKIIYVVAKKNDKGEWVIISVWDKYKKEILQNKNFILGFIRKMFK